MCNTGLLIREKALSNRPESAVQVLTVIRYTITALHGINITAYTSYVNIDKSKYRSCQCIPLEASIH